MLNVVLILAPIVVIDAIAATAISAAISEYSIAVTPLWFFAKVRAFIDALVDRFADQQPWLRPPSKLIRRILGIGGTGAILFLLVLSAVWANLAIAYQLPGSAGLCIGACLALDVIALAALAGGRAALAQALAIRADLRRRLCHISGLVGFHQRLER